MNDDRDTPKSDLMDEIKFRYILFRPMNNASHFTFTLTIAILTITLEEK
jgi:hypothetical protein